MNPLRVVVLSFAALPLARRRLLVCAAIAAALLMSMYVQLLHHSLARGDQLREVQRNAGKGGAKPAGAAETGKQPGLALPRLTAVAARPE
jgi:hypothetical protein